MCLCQEGDVERSRLRHVDMIFRLYLPLYALIKQTNTMKDLQEEMKKLLLDEKAAAFVRKLVREAPVESKGKDSASLDFSRIIARFLSHPDDYHNNRQIKQMETNLMLTLRVKPNDRTVSRN